MSNLTSFFSNIETSHLILGFTAGVLVTLAVQNKFAFAFSRLNSGNMINHAVSSRDYVKMILVVRRDLGMKPGKIAAQCSHAAVGCYRQAQKAKSKYLPIWEMYGQPKIVVMVVRNDLGMGKGKVAAQCAHAAVGCVKTAYKTESPFLKNWMRQGQPKIVVKCDKPGEEALQELARKAQAMGVTNVVIHDAGHTQVASGTATVLGLGPATNQMLDEISGHLKLL